MQNKQPHFSLAAVKPALSSLETSVKTLMDSAGGTQAVLQDALGLIETAASSENVPLALVEQVISMLADQIKASSKP